MLDPEVKAMLEQGAAAGALSYDKMAPDAARLAYRAARSATMAPALALAEVRELSLLSDGTELLARLYRPQPDGILPLLIFFHGGGWVIGDLESHDGLCRRLAREAGVAVLAIDYRLAPEHPFPAAIRDAQAAFNYALAEAEALGIDPARIAVGGDSAGGNLAAVLCLMRREAGQSLPQAQMLVYPALDFAMNTPSHQEFAQGYVLTRDLLNWFRDHYLAGAADPQDWRNSPLRAPNLAGLPETILLTTGYDPLRDEGEAYGRRLLEAGVAVSMLRIPGQVHGFMPMDGVMSAAVPAARWLGRQLKGALSAG